MKDLVNLKLENNGRKELASWLTSARKEKGLSISEVSRLAPTTHPQSLRWVEQGARTPSLSLLHKLVKVYGIPRKQAMSILLDIIEGEVSKNLKTRRSVS